MEFKDASSAAEAAAASAERASVAARAAAEISKLEKIMRQYSTTGSQYSCLRDDELAQEFHKTYSSERANGASRAASEFPIHGDGIRQFSISEEAQEYGVHDAKHVSAEKASHVHPRLPEYDSFAAHFRSLKFSNARQ